MWIDRLSMQVRSLFVPTVTISTLLDLIGDPAAPDAIKQLYDWERDRLFTLAKGLAVASVGVLTTIIVDGIEGKIKAPIVSVYLCAALVVLLLSWAAFILAAVRRLSEEYALALRVFT